MGARVVTMRTAKMVGKIVTGTLVATGNSRKKYWIRWNRFKRDDVWVHPAVIKTALGENPEIGVTRCEITELGPDTATAWRKHPQTEEVTTVLERSFSNARKAVPLTRQTRRPRFVNSKADKIRNWRARATPLPVKFTGAL